MRVHPAALKHGVSPEDAVQAADWSQWIEPRKSDQTIALEYKIGTALGCASPDFELARTGFISRKTLILENTLKGATKAHQQFVLTRE